MNYHDITKEDMLNGEGLRVVLWVSGCSHHCHNCQNPITWDEKGGLPFDKKAEDELFEALNKPHIEGITFSGGDPLFPQNRQEVGELALEIHKKYPNKDIWLYTGYTYEQIKNWEYLKCIDVLVDGPYIPSMKELGLKWKGSSNQRVIDVDKTIKAGSVVIKY